jgi:hypothetical protein
VLVIAGVWVGDAFSGTQRGSVGSDRAVDAAGGTWDMLLRVIQSEADVAGRVDRSVSVDYSIVRAHQHLAVAKRVIREDRARREEHIGARLNDKNSRCCRDEPGDHALGRSRGGLSTKIHAAVDGRGRPLVILVLAAALIWLAD